MKKNFQLGKAIFCICILINSAKTFAQAPRESIDDLITCISASKIATKVTTDLIALPEFNNRQGIYEVELQAVLGLNPSKGPYMSDILSNINKNVELAVKKIRSGDTNLRNQAINTSNQCPSYLRRKYGIKS